MNVVNPADAAVSLSPEHTVNDVLLRFPRCANVFNAFGVDSCCGGAVSLADAAADVGVEPGMLLSALEFAALSDRLARQSA
jgi:regulator of cell morphogenesis and NO signaling